MKKNFITYLMTVLGLTSACGQNKFQNINANAFAKLITEPDVTVLDVRTPEEYNEGHIDGAINIDINRNDFVERAKSLLPTGNTIAIYCKSGRRSANAADKLTNENYKIVNLAGGIMAWKLAGKHITSDTYEVDVFKTASGKTVRFHTLMHASIRIEYDGKEIEIDPVMKLGNRQVDYTTMPKADFILVTHEHADHFDKQAINQLTSSSTVLISNKRCADMLGYGRAMNNGDTQNIADDFTVEAVPAYNTTEAHQKFHPKGRDNGFIISIDGLRIYIAGDTEDIPEMADIKDIDIAFLPCNQPYTMTPKQLVSAARMVKPKILFPYHYGQTDVSNLPTALKDDGIEVRIRHYE